MDDCFSKAFQSLTERIPLSWQTRLYERHFSQGDFPPLIDIPTGLGKTMVMAIWLIARAKHPDKIPTRLVYVVDRRTVVDQATDLAEEFAYLLSEDPTKKFAHVEKRQPKLIERRQEYADTLGQLRTGLTQDFAISTLRGQLADNRDWSRDPSCPAIIIGTVDLIGSALLFSGYRSSYKRRPLEAGLLGQDSLLVLDEAHLSKQFEQLLVGRKNEDGGHQNGIEQFQAGKGKPMCVIRMSATSVHDDTGRFKLEESDLNDNVIEERFTAKKRLTITRDVDPKRLNDTMAGTAIDLARNQTLRGTRIVVFVRKPDDAKAIRKAVSEHVIETVDESGSKPKKVKASPYKNSVEILTGTMRGLERDELVEKPVLKRFLNGDEVPGENDNPVFLISTSAGEVGFDLNGDHLVGDEAPLDSWIQRLGRVNRRGKGTAIVQVFAKTPAEKKKEGEAGKHTIDSASANAIEAMKQLPKAELLDADKRPGPIFDASPYALHNLAKPDNAISPKPTTLDLTDILLDAWSMTSITKPMPGRPEVGPWLRGIDDELPHTTIAWRAELDLDGFANLDLDDIQEWFDTHRILTHETLSVPTSSKSGSSAEKWLTSRWEQLGKTLGEKEQRRIGARNIVIDRSGMKIMPISDLIGELNRGNTSSIRHADLILPASFGGIERGIGLLDADAPAKPVDEKNADEQTRTANAQARRIAPDVADVAPGRIRQRIVEITIDGEKQEPQFIGGGAEPSFKTSLRLELESDDERVVRLVSYVPRREKLEIGSEKQTLMQHVGAVGKKSDEILSRLLLPRELESIVSLAVQFAADWHDHGKNREYFQRTVGGMHTDSVEKWRAQLKLENDGKCQCLGKSGGKDLCRAPRGYRHEFGSLREFTDAFKAGELLDDAGKPINQEVFDLAMHLIATHHGRGRPHFPNGGFDPDDESRSDEIHTESIRRFARLQKKYGWWRLVWLENLLRCADALASADQGAEDDPADTEGCPA